jgi:hypothetical protein
MDAAAQCPATNRSRDPVGSAQGAYPIAEMKPAGDVEQRDSLLKRSLATLQQARGDYIRLPALG